MRMVLLIAILASSLIAGCGAVVKIKGYPASEIANVSKEECKQEYEKVRVLGALPETGTYIELGYMDVSQTSVTGLERTSEEKQIEEARILACQWGADAIVVVSSGLANASGSWLMGAARQDRETKIIAVKFK